MAEGSKTKKKLTCRNKRHRQNVRTYQRKLKRRTERAKRLRYSSVAEMEQALGIKRWTKPPTNKAQGQLLK